MAIAGLMLGYIGMALLALFVVRRLASDDWTIDVTADRRPARRRADLLASSSARPRTEEAEERLDKTLLELEPLGPSFVSVTYGAGGSTRDTTDGWSSTSTRTRR